jgi:hypothetical protein
MNISFLSKRWPQAEPRHHHGRAALLRALAAMSGGGVALLLAAGPASAQLAAAPPRPGTTPSVAAPSASSLDTFYTGTDGRVYNKIQLPGSHSTELVGGHLIGGPAAMWIPPGPAHPHGLLAVFGRGTDNRLWWAQKSVSGWSRWTSLGGTLTAKPAAAADPYGFSYGVFARGTDGGLWARFAVPNTTTWGPWVRQGGHLLPGTAPAAAYFGLGDASGGASVVVVGTDRRVYERFGPAGNGTWKSLGGQTTSNPAFTAPTRDEAGNHFVGTGVVFIRGTDGAAWYNQVAGSTPGVTPGWHSLGGTLTSGLAAATAEPALGPTATTPTSLIGLGTGSQILLDSGTWPALGGWHPMP